MEVKWALKCFSQRLRLSGRSFDKSEALLASARTINVDIGIIESIQLYRMMVFHLKLYFAASLERAGII